MELLPKAEMRSVWDMPSLVLRVGGFELELLWVAGRCFRKRIHCVHNS